jgi:hypothetical protein
MAPVGLNILDKARLRANMLQPSALLALGESPACVDRD